MESPLKNRGSFSPVSIAAMLLLLALCGAPAQTAPVSGTSGNAPLPDTSLSKESLQLRGAELDNYIYEGSDTAKGSPQKTASKPHSQKIWILILAGGAAAVVGLGLALLLSV